MKNLVLMAFLGMAIASCSNGSTTEETTTVDSTTAVIDSAFSTDLTADTTATVNVEDTATTK